jgi:hypothetical protein
VVGQRLANARVGCSAKYSLTSDSVAQLGAVSTASATLDGADTALVTRLQASFTRIAVALTGGSGTLGKALVLCDPFLYLLNWWGSRELRWLGDQPRSGRYLSYSNTSSSVTSPTLPWPPALLGPWLAVLGNMVQEVSSSCNAKGALSMVTGVTVVVLAIVHRCADTHTPWCCSPCSNPQPAWVHWEPGALRVQHACLRV